MYLHKVDIVGFKSFAKKTTLEFVPAHDARSTKGITSIVGPNGSGKSNVAEAIRWVLGEQSMKSLRGKKSEDVIFSGSERASRLGMAEVSLYLNNEDRKVESVDLSEIVITRKVFRDGHSEYRINNRDVRLADVLLLVAECNVGQRSYSVIGQGMVDEILMATPLNRIQFFEDAAGIRPLQIKLNDSLRKLERAKENLAIAGVQLAEVEPRLKNLKRQVERLEKREVLTAELTQLQGLYFGHLLARLTGEKQSVTHTLSLLDADRKKIDTDAHHLRTELTNLTRESAHSDQLILLQKEYQNLVNTKNALRDKEFEARAEELRAVAVSEQSVSTGVLKTLLDELHGAFSILDPAREHEESQTLFGRIRDFLMRARGILTQYRRYVPEEKKNPSTVVLGEVQKEISHTEESIRVVSQKINDMVALEKKEKTKLWQIQNTLKDKQREIDRLVEKINEQKVAIARIDIRIEDTHTQITEEVDGGLAAITAHTASPTVPFDEQPALHRIHTLKREVESIGGIDHAVKQEYADVAVRYDFLKNQTSDLERSLADLEVVIRDLDERMRSQFDAAFENINKHFSQYFKQLFNGGKAYLELLKNQPSSPDENDETSAQETSQTADEPTRNYRYAGVDIKATPPGKKLQSLSMLSGGEKALTSIALICAIIANNPSPFVVLDEVDAALDEANSLRLADILDDLRKQTQFVVITHNRATMERSDILYGVTMGDDGISRLISLKLEEAAQHTNR